MCAFKKRIRNLNNNNVLMIIEVIKTPDPSNPTLQALTPLPHPPPQRKSTTQTDTTPAAADPGVAIEAMGQRTSRYLGILRTRILPIRASVENSRTCERCNTGSVGFRQGFVPVFRGAFVSYRKRASLGL